MSNDMTGYFGEKPSNYHHSMNVNATYTLANNPLFYAIVPEPYKQYYNRIVRQSFNWYDGYVDWFHNANSGIFSTRLYYTIVSKLANLVVGNSLMYDDLGEVNEEVKKYRGKDVTALQLIQEVSQRDHWTKKAKQLVEWGSVGGDSIIKLDSIGNKELTAQVFRKDNYFFDTDVRGNITAISLLLYMYTYTKSAVKGDTENQLFYLLEEREYKNNVPYVKYSVKRGTGARSTNKDISLTEESVDWESLPNKIRDSIKRDFPSCIVGKWQKLPLRDLGVYLYKNTQRVSFAPALPFGEPSSTNNFHAFMTYDFLYSSMNTDMYIGRGKVFVPKAMQAPGKGGSSYNVGFDDFLLQGIDYTDPASQKPMAVQFDLRANDWKEMRNNVLQTVATNFGISERTIATYLVPASEKPTAREVSAEENATTAYAEDKRGFLSNTWNEMLETVLEFHGFKNSWVNIRFSKAGLTNFANVVQQVSVLRQNGLIDLKSALEKVHYDMNDKQIEDMISLLDKEDKEKQQNEAVPQSYEKMEKEQFEDSEYHIKKEKK